MRVAVLSDTHGNLPALEAVLEAIEQDSPDLVVMAGDAAFGGPWPAECIDFLRQRGIPAVRGNTDEFLVAVATGRPPATPVEDPASTIWPVPPSLLGMPGASSDYAASRSIISPRCRSASSSPHRPARRWSSSMPHRPARILWSRPMPRPSDYARCSTRAVEQRSPTGTSTSKPAGRSVAGWSSRWAVSASPSMATSAPPTRSWSGTGRAGAPAFSAFPIRSSGRSRHWSTAACREPRRRSASSRRLAHREPEAGVVRLARDRRRGGAQCSRS
jgi:hypothetical protein